MHRHNLGYFHFHQINLTLILFRGYLARNGALMKNLILGVIAKISKMDAEAKQLAAKVEAQSLLIGALLLTIGKNGGMNEMLENVRKAINAALDAADTPLKTDAEILLNEFNNLLLLTQLLETNDAEIDLEALRSMPGETAAE